MLRLESVTLVRNHQTWRWLQRLPIFRAPCNSNISQIEKSEPANRTNNGRTLDFPLPTTGHAIHAQNVLQVDEELSTFVRRTISTVSPSPNTAEKSVLRAHYQATSNRMLRVSLNGFMESLILVLGIMEELDEDLL
jgi:EKC/KEOPS complex subunit PCC1/LAGE3